MPDIDIPFAIKGDPDTAFEEQTPVGFVYDNDHWALVSPDLGNNPEAPADDSVPSAWCPNHEQWESKPTDREALYGLSFALQNFVRKAEDLVADIHATLSLPGELSPGDVADLIARGELAGRSLAYNMEGVEQLTPPDTGQHVASKLLAEIMPLPGVAISDDGFMPFGLTEEDEMMLMSNPDFRAKLEQLQELTGDGFGVASVEIEEDDE